MTLRDKLQALTAPSREVDAEIFNKMFRHTGAHAIRVGGDWLVDTQGTEHGNHIPHYTASLDAAVALVEQEMPGLWDMMHMPASGTYCVMLKSTYNGAHTLPAVALLLALVNAKEIE